MADVGKKQFLAALADLAVQWSVESKLEALTRDVEGVRHIFQARCWKKRDHWVVAPGVMVRIDEIERIYHRTSGVPKELQRQSHTIGSSLAELLGTKYSDFRLEFSSREQMVAVAASLKSALDGLAEPYFGKFSTVPSIDVLLNTEPAGYKRESPAIPHRYFIGLISAALVKRPDYDDLEATYRHLTTKLNQGFYAPQFEALAHDLRDHWKQAAAESPDPPSPRHVR